MAEKKTFGRKTTTGRIVHFFYTFRPVAESNNFFYTFRPLAEKKRVKVARKEEKFLRNKDFENEVITLS